MNPASTFHTSPFHLLIRSPEPVHAAVLEDVARRAGHRVHRCPAVETLPDSIFERPLDSILLFPETAVVTELAWALRERERLTCGLILVAEQWDRALAKAAATAGIDAFLSMPATPAGLNLALLQAEAVRLQVHAAREQAADLARRLAERKLIERAKGVLMTRKQLSEEQAFRAMRSEAMRRRISLARLSAELLEEETGGR